MQADAFHQSPVLGWRQMEIRTPVVGETARPAQAERRLLEDVLEAPPLALRDELQERAAAGPQRVADAAERRRLVRHPVERVERDDEVERVAIREPGRVADLERQVRVIGDEVLPGEVDHVARRVDADHGAGR